MDDNRNSADGCLDVNCDGNFDNADLEILKTFFIYEYVGDLKELENTNNNNFFAIILSQPDIMVYDIDHNGKIDNVDMKYLENYLLFKNNSRFNYRMLANRNGKTTKPRDTATCAEED